MRPLDFTGGAIWITLGALLLSALLVGLLFAAVVDREWTGGRLIAIGLTALGLIALLPLSGLVDESAPLAGVALKLAVVALFVGPGVVIYHFVARR